MERWWIVLILLIGLYWGQAKKKKFTMNYTTDVVVCDDPVSQAFLETGSLKPVRINETTTKLEGRMSFKQGLTAPTKMVSTVERVMVGGYKEVIATFYVQDICEKFAKRQEDEFFGPYLRKMNVPDCPIPPGDYMVDNMIVDMTQIPSEFFLQGSYTFTTTFTSVGEIGKGLLGTPKETKLGCVTLGVTVE